MNLLKIRHQNLKNEKFNTNYMEKNLYIDASHPDETRVVLKENGNIEDYEYEGIKNTLIKNNIYLGKVSRIEPSLQAAFIDFGRERHGFLSLSISDSSFSLCFANSSLTCFSSSFIFSKSLEGIW